MVLSTKRPSKSNTVQNIEQLKAAVQEPALEPMKRLNVNLPESVLKQFKSKTASEGISMSETIHKWVNEYLSK